MGTADFAVPTLKALAGAGHRIISVYTQPDRPSGRGLRLAGSPVKLAARELGLKLLQPSSLRPDDEAARFKSMAPEIAVVVAYGLKLPPAFLLEPSHGCLNLHPSLLPRYRGAAPINRALINGDPTTGISIIRMSDRMDAGDLVFQREVEIGPEENAGLLGKRLADMGAALMVRCLGEVASGKASYAAQDEALATMAPKLTAAERLIKWDRPRREVANLIRGLAPKPGAYSLFRGRRLEIAVVSEAELDGAVTAGNGPGTLVGIDQKLGPLVMAADGPLALVQVRPEGKGLMSGGEFVRGYRPKEGEGME